MAVPPPAIGDRTHDWIILRSGPLVNLRSTANRTGWTHSNSHSSHSPTIPRYLDCSLRTPGSAGRSPAESSLTLKGGNPQPRLNRSAPKTSGQSASGDDGNSQVQRKRFSGSRTDSLREQLPREKRGL